MTVDTTAPPLTDMTRRRPRTMRVCDYVDLPFEEVTRQLARPGAIGLLAASLRAALGADAGSVTVRASSPEMVGHAVAQIKVRWQAVDHGGGEAHGSGTLTVLVVQSGRDAVTELLVTVPVADEVAGTAASVTHRFLGEVSARLVAACAA